MDNVFMLGDFNIICDPEVDSLSVSPKLYKVPVEALTELLRKFELIDVFRTLNPDEQCFTFSRRGLLLRNGDRAPPVMNRLDYAFIRHDELPTLKSCQH